MVKNLAAGLGVLGTQAQPLAEALDRGPAAHVHTGLGGHSPDSQDLDAINASQIDTRQVMQFIVQVEGRFMLPLGAGSDAGRQRWRRAHD